MKAAAKYEVDGADILMEWAELTEHKASNN